MMVRFTSLVNCVADARALHVLRLQSTPMRSPVKLAETTGSLIASSSASENAFEPKCMAI